ncbi:hypothetical protein FY048_12760 [Acinetobacter sp. 1124_18A]|uniref:hypothetical protein n=1 Tax=Acinetobacter sp. 1124_18A TaxID=2605958 RepID=UPI00405A1130
MKYLKYILILLIFFGLLIFFFDWKTKLNTFIKYNHIFKALYLGEIMKKKNMIMESCSYGKVKDINLKAINLIDPINRGRVQYHANCIKDAKLVYIGIYQNDYGVATYRCYEKDLVLEYSWTDFQDSCSILEVKKEWNIPEKETIHSLNTP